VVSAIPLHKGDFHRLTAVYFKHNIRAYNASCREIVLMLDGKIPRNGMLRRSAITTPRTSIPSYKRAGEAFALQHAFHGHLGPIVEQGRAILPRHPENDMHEYLPAGRI
jgi:hypothetical protein